MFTGKQERNGATGSSATQVSAQPGPDYTSQIAAAKGGAESDERWLNDHLDKPPLVTTVVDWETGVAGHDLSGEA